jgi:hypothetical protein
MTTKLTLATLSFVALFGGTASAAPLQSVEQRSTSWYPAAMCHTPYGSCVLVSPLPAGAPCTCYTPAGAFHGRAG